MSLFFVTVVVFGMLVDTCFLVQVLPVLPGTLMTVDLITDLVVEPTELVQMVLTLQVDLEVVDVVFVVP